MGGPQNPQDRFITVDFIFRNVWQRLISLSVLQLQIDSLVAQKKLTSQAQNEFAKVKEFSILPIYF